MVTSSGDTTCILWDIPTKTAVRTFLGHHGDVMSVSISGDTFVSGSCDTTAKLWDLRTASCEKTFLAHQSDINAVQFFPDGKAFGTGSDDSACHLFDTRCMRMLNTYRNEDITCGVTSLDFSHSGRVLFAAYDDYFCNAWDTIHYNATNCNNFLTAPPNNIAHDNRISCLGVNKEGSALCTGSWDFFLKVWA